MFLRSLIFNIGFWVWIALLGTAGLPIACIWRPFSFTVARVWALGSLLMLRVLCGITYEIRGLEHLPKGAVLIASKHQSAWDTVIFWLLLHHPAYVLKRQLLYFPVFGWYLMLLENIYIDRTGGASALKRMLAKARSQLVRGRPIVIFPEGTRTVPGAPSVYHPGVAALYQQLDVVCVPVALNSGKFWPRNAFTKTPGHIVLEFLPPIPPGLKGRDFLKTLQERVEAATTTLLK